MGSYKLRRMDMVSGITEMQLHCFPKYNQHRNTFLDHVVPDIVICRNINPFKYDLYTIHKSQKSNSIVMIS